MKKSAPRLVLPLVLLVLPRLHLPISFFFFFLFLFFFLILCACIITLVDYNSKKAWFTEEDNDNDDTKIVKSRVSGFSRGKLEAGRNELGLCTARYESKSCC